jgi:hypothetical protein
MCRNTGAWRALSTDSLIGEKSLQETRKRVRSAHPRPDASSVATRAAWSKSCDFGNFGLSECSYRMEIIHAAQGPFL